MCNIKIMSKNTTQEERLDYLVKAIEDGDYIIGGVLTDAYQRKMTSKIVNVQ